MQMKIVLTYIFISTLKKKLSPKLLMQIADLLQWRTYEDFKRHHNPKYLILWDFEETLAKYRIGTPQ